MDITQRLVLETEGIHGADVRGWNGEAARQEALEYEREMERYNNANGESEMTLDEALEYAAQHLPSGAEVEIYVEKGAATVAVSDWDGNWRGDFDSADMTLADQVVDCVKWANEQPPPPNRWR